MGPSIRGNMIPKGMSLSRINQYTPQQEQLSDQSFANVGPDSYTSRLAQGDQSAFEETERPALRQFSGLQGNIASRFSGQGLGGRRSSGFQNTMNAASGDFAQQLQSRRQEMRQGAIRDLHSMSQDLLGNRQYDQQLSEKPQPWWQKFATNLGEGAVRAGSAYLTGGASELGNLSGFLGGGQQQNNVNSYNKTGDYHWGK